MRKKMTLLFVVLLVFTSLVLLNSVVFSCRNVSAFCVNYADTELEQQVLQKADIGRNQNIFFLPDKKIKQNVESQVVNVRVLGTERIFSNTVIIHFAKILDYLALPHNGSYVICNNNGKVTAFSDDADLENLILVKMRGTLIEPTQNQLFSTTVELERDVIVAVLDALDRLSYHEKDRIRLVKEIDITNPEYISIKTRTGVEIVIIGTHRLDEKLQYAFSVYALSDDYKHSGKITAYLDNSTNRIKAAYDE